MAFDATVGGAAATSYLTLEAAEAYFLDRLGVSLWDEADGDDDRYAALIMATARLDQEPYVGYVVSSTQRLQWPRGGVSNGRGGTYATTAIPDIVQAATCEMALFYLANADTDDATVLQGFQNLRIGSLDITPTVAAVATALPDRVRRLLASVRSGGLMVRVDRA